MLVGRLGAIGWRQALSIQIDTRQVKDKKKDNGKNYPNQLLIANSGCQTVFEKSLHNRRRATCTVQDSTPRPSAPHEKTFRTLYRLK